MKDQTFKVSNSWMQKCGFRINEAPMRVLKTLYSATGKPEYVVLDQGWREWVVDIRRGMFV